MPEDDLTVTVENNPNKPDTSTDSSVPEGTVSEDNASEDDASEGTASEGTVSEDNASQEASAEGSDDESTAEPVESSTVEKVFQILFIVIMTVGIVGLPVYYWFNSKKKAMNTTDENEDNGGENE
jgi:cobalamin biosynthesis protein CobT